MNNCICSLKVAAYMLLIGFTIMLAIVSTSRISGCKPSASDMFYLMNRMIKGAVQLDRELIPVTCVIVVSAFLAQIIGRNDLRIKCRCKLPFTAMLTIFGISALFIGVLMQDRLLHGKAFTISYSIAVIVLYYYLFQHPVFGKATTNTIEQVAEPDRKHVAQAGGIGEVD